MIARAAAPLCLLALACACLDLSVPVDVTIRCDPDDDATCPDGTVCQPGLLVCVDEGELDDTAPTVALTLEPALASRLQPLTLRAVSDEALPEEPTGVLVLPDGTERPLDFISRDSNPDARDYRFEYEPLGDEPEDVDVIVRVRAVDRVGLAAEGEAVARFDFTAPAPLPDDSAQSALGAVVVVIAPRGTPEDDTPIWRLEAPPGSVEAGAKVVMRTASNTLPFDEANARVDGSARADIPPGTYALWVSQRDVAGNESALVRVREVALTMGVDRFAPQESTLSSRLHARDDVGPLSAGSMPSPELGITLRGPMTAARIDRTTPILADPMLVTDLARGELLLLGGQPLGDDEGRSFSWNGEAWSPRTLNTPPRSGHALVSSPTNGDVLLIGGAATYVGQEAVPEVWRYDGQAFTVDPLLIRAPLDTTVYEARCKHPAAFFDPARPDTLILHGCPVTWEEGFETAQWEWDGESEWRIVQSPPDPEGDGNPLALEGACLAFDHARGVALMFGGRNRFVDEPPLGETWEFDGQGWRRTHDADPSGVNAPSPRAGASCAWDARTGRTYLVGGWDGTGDALSVRQLWAHDDNGWTRLPDMPNDEFPESRVAGVDPLRGELVVYDGPRFNPVAPRATLVFDGAAWREAALRSAAPSARAGATLVAMDDGLVLHGSTNEDGSLWRLDTQWSLLGALAAGNRFGAEAVARGGELIVLGGYPEGPSDVVRVDLDTITDPPTTLETTPVAPLPLDATGWSELAVAVDPASGVIAAAGGTLHFADAPFLTDTAVWFLDGSTWTRGPDLALPTDDMRTVLLTFDTAAGAFVLYGNVPEGGGRATYVLPFSGIGSLAGASWQQLDESAERPAQAEGGALVFDETLGAPLLIGGSAHETLDGTTDEAYVFIGDAWVTTPIVDLEHDGPLPVLQQAAGAYDRARARTVLYGGSDGAFQATARTYSLDALAHARPAVVLTLDARAAGIDGVEAVLALDVDVTAGASGGGVDGAALRVWSGARWVELGTTDAPASAAGVLRVAAPSEALTHALFGETVRVQVAARGENGAARARLHVPLAWLTARLRTR